MPSPQTGSQAPQSGVHENPVGQPPGSAVGSQISPGVLKVASPHAGQGSPGHTDSVWATHSPSHPAEQQYGSRRHTSWTHASAQRLVPIRSPAVQRSWTQGGGAAQF